jgi:hypothetical protein
MPIGHVHGLPDTFANSLTLVAGRLKNLWDFSRLQPSNLSTQSAVLFLSSLLYPLRSRAAAPLAGIVYIFRPANPKPRCASPGWPSQLVKIQPSPYEKQFYCFFFNEEARAGIGKVKVVLIFIVVADQDFQSAWVLLS